GGCVFRKKITYYIFLPFFACGVGFGLFCGGLFACWRGVVVGGCIVLFMVGLVGLTSIFLVELTETGQIWQIIF
ncbi:hypothetical protein, partial [Microcystis sp. M061S2]|uniref:hypothetical protein n=1 Tax=Microcystis sp. M061S2 TaxID=2771171 RepID=UPI0025910A0A